MIPFNKASVTDREEKYVLEALRSSKLCGDGPFTKKCHQWFEQKLNCPKALLTPSCTHSLEMAAILIDLKPGDEVIMPSFTFVSTANAFVLRGAKIVFVDIRPDTMNIDEKLIEAAITQKTRAIVPVHYAGVACEMDEINRIAKKHHLYVIEDAAQGMMSTYKGKALGTLGDIGAYSFHETKNYTSGGEGGLTIINNPEFAHRAEIIREKGTNRSQFFRGMVDKYSWVDIGSSYLPSEIQAAFLYAQLERSEEINRNRLQTWNEYYTNLEPLQQKGYIELPVVPENCQHNAHMFYLKVENLETRTKLINVLKENGISAAFHYVPLHSSSAGTALSRFYGQDKYTTSESERILRMPIWTGLNEENQLKQIFKTLNSFFG
ncbi:MAG: dTDP-4-amino-4,6-dideoxygalactose transaminase [Bacteriovoracaceae bacterium]|nr:dTDP-4-amino-4,6-dideoxygalactose transaminase [Bacteriovoracaceae bacterium]